MPGTDGRPVVCVFNLGPAAPITVALDSVATCEATDLWSGRTTHVDGGLVTVPLLSNEFAILELAGC
jgi:hypothetical protein